MTDDLDSARFFEQMTDSMISTISPNKSFGYGTLQLELSSFATTRRPEIVPSQLCGDFHFAVHELVVVNYFTVAANAVC